MFSQTYLTQLLVPVNMSDHHASNVTGGDLDEVTLGPQPTVETLDYAEIALLVVLVAIGGPLNLYSLYRTVHATSGRQNVAASVCYQQQDSSTTTARRKSVFEVLHDVTRRTSVMLQGGPVVKGNGTRSVSRLLTLKLHLTIANSMIIWLYALSQICWLATYQWRGGDLLCRCIMFVHAFCFYATSNLVALIAIDRVYVAFHINRPFSESAMARYNLPAFLYASWIFAFLCSAPQLVLWQVYEPFPEQWKFVQCVTIWTARKYDLAKHRRDPEIVAKEGQVILEEKIYNLLHLALVFWIPALVVIVSYALIVIKFHYNIRMSRRTASIRNPMTRKTFDPRLDFLNSSETTYSGSASPSRPPDHRHRRPARDPPAMQLRKALQVKHQVERTPVSTLASLANPLQQFVCGPVVVENNAVIRLRRAKRRTAKKSFWILLAYVICWSPYNILALWRFIGPPFEHEFLEFMYNLIVLNAVVNPWIYGL